MKKLLAMMMVLCMVYGGGMAEDMTLLDMLALLESWRTVTGTQTLGSFTFTIPEGWTADLGATSVAFRDSIPGLKNDGLKGESFTVTFEADPAMRIVVGIDPVTSMNNQDAMDTVNKAASLDMVSPAELAVYQMQYGNSSGQMYGPKIDFVTIGSFAGAPLRRTYSGFIGEYIDADGTEQRARVSAVVWSSAEIGKQIVIQQITPQHAKNIDYVVDEFMMSFCYGGQSGSCDESAVIAAQKQVSENDFSDASIEGAKYLWGKGAYLFDLTLENEDLTNTDAFTLVTVDTDKSNMYLGDGFDLSDFGAMGEMIENYNPNDYDMGAYDWDWDLGW